MVYLITGKAGAGKTEYSLRLYKEMEAEGFQVVRIDGDDFRVTTKNADYSDEGRIKNLISAAQLAAKLELEGNIVLMSFIAPRREWRNEMRKLWRKSRVIYVPGGRLWEGTTYDRPDEEELNIKINDYGSKNDS